jgi:hypothetical protein
MISTGAGRFAPVPILIIVAAAVLMVGLTPPVVVVCERGSLRHYADDRGKQRGDGGCLQNGVDDFPDLV